MNKGDTVRLKNGRVGTIVQVKSGDFIGDPHVAIVQWVDGGVVKTIPVTETELKARK